MVKDLDSQADSSTEIQQGTENKSPSYKEQPHYLTSAIIHTAKIPSSPLSCSMGVASKVASTAGHLPSPNQILDHNTPNFTNSNDHLHADNYHSNHNMDGAFTISTNSSYPFLPEGKTAELTEHQNEEKMVVATEKAVQKKRGRGRPPKLKPIKQEKELDHQREEVSSISSINSMNSFEKDPLYEDFDSCSLKEYRLDVFDQCPPRNTTLPSTSLPSENYVSDSAKLDDLILPNSPSDCILEHSNDQILIEMEEDSVGSDSWQNQANCHNISSDNQIPQAEINTKQISSRASGRPRGRPRLHKMGVRGRTEGNTATKQLMRNANLSRKNTSPSSTPLLKDKLMNGNMGTEEELDNSTASIDVADEISPRKLHKKFGHFQGCSGQENDPCLEEGDTSSQDSKEVADSPKGRIISYDSDVINSSLPIKVKSRWRNSSQYEFNKDHAIDATLEEDYSKEERYLPDSSQPPTYSLPKVRPNLIPEKEYKLEQSVLPKRESRIRGERRSSSRRTSPVQSDILNPSTTQTQIIQTKNTKLKQQNTQKDMESSVAVSEAVTNNPIPIKETTLETRHEVEKRLKSFEHISTNKFICERRRNKQTRDMECDCSLSKEDIKAGVYGCGDDCLNRLLMVECNKSCSLGANCGNQKFQNVENSSTEVFKTEYKGVGLRATQDIVGDTFIMEYVGEVLDPQRFRKRAKKYSQDDVTHFYFMALTTKYIIDATVKGNVSRFINHSCDPNAETQKWTVDGELRVGFFSKRKIYPGEEITFDYKYERYGQNAQKCYCGASSCRGWLGGEPEKDKKEQSEEDEALEQEEEEFSSSSEEQEDEAEGTEPEISAVFPTTQLLLSSLTASPAKEKRFSRRRLRKSPRKIKNFETDEFEEEIERLKITGIRTKGHTVELCRLMVRAADSKTRLILSHLLLDADSPCTRLFLDYHGLKILNSWMSELTWNSAIDLDVKVAVEDVLSILNIPHKTMLVDSHVWQTISSWSTVQVSSKPQENCKQLIKEENRQPLSEASSVATSPTSSFNSSTPQTNESKVVLTSREDVLDHSLEDSTVSSTNNNPTEQQLENDQKELVSKACEPSEPKQMQEDKLIVSCESSLKGEEIATILSNQKVEERKVRENGRETDETKPDVLPIQKAEQQQYDQSQKIPIPLIKLEDGVMQQDLIGKVGDTLQDDIYVLNAKMVMVKGKALSLLSAWQILKEVFKIPRKELVKLRAEHEREVDDAEAHATSRTNQFAGGEDAKFSGFGGFNQQRFGFGNSTWNKYSYDRFRPPPRSYSPPLKNRETTCSRFDDKTGRLHTTGLSRDHRRYYISQKFEMEKEEKRKRDLLQAWHENKCYYLRLDPGITPMFPEIPEFYFDPTVGTWYQMPELPAEVDVWGKLGFPHMACLPSEAFRETDSPLPDPALIYPPGVVKVSYLYGQPMSLDPSFNNAQIDMAVPEQPIYPQELSPINHGNHQSTPRQLHTPLCYIDPETGQEMPIPEEHNNHKNKPTFRDSERLQPSTAPSLDALGEGNNDLILPSLYGVSDQCSVAPQEYQAEIEDKPPPTSLPDYYKNISEKHRINTSNVQTHAETKVTAASEEGNSQSKSSDNREKSNVLTMKLPTSWKIAKDIEGRTYYYNTKTKETQWQPPNGTEALQAPDNNVHFEEINSSGRLAAHQIDIEDASSDSEDDDEEMEGVVDDGEDLIMDEDGDESDIDEEEDDNDLGLDMELDAKSLDNPQGPYSDLSAQERSLLLRFSKLSKEERQNERRQKRERDREKREYERKRRRERHGKHRKDGLVQEHLIPKRGEREKTDLMTFKEIRERLANRDAIRERQDIEEREEAERDREEERIKLRQIEKEKKEQHAAAERQAVIDKQLAEEQIVSKEENLLAEDIVNSKGQQMIEEQNSDNMVENNIVSSVGQSSKTTTAAADTSSEVARKIKEKFMKEVSRVIVKVLDPFKKTDATRAKIQTIEDFKHLAKKLTEYILLKELKHCPRIEDLRFTDSVKKKTAEFVRKYMLKFGDTYKPSPQK